MKNKSNTNETTPASRSLSQRVRGWVQRFVMRSELPHYLFTDHKWYRSVRGGRWLYYQTSLPMAPVWVQVEFFSDRLSCYLDTIYAEDYSA